MPTFTTKSLTSTSAAVLLSLTLLLSSSQACNESVCGPVVSKCMLTRSCNCSLADCSCCKECFSCLGRLYLECCSCFELCPRPSSSAPLNRNSNVEDLPDPRVSLFEALTSGPDAQDRWQALNASHSVKTDSGHLMLFDCSVAFLNECTSWSKCRESCSTMGAAGLRWFHDGCCECLGDTCINYGLNVSSCSRCPLSDNDVEMSREEEEEEEMTAFDDYGQDMDEDDQDGNFTTTQATTTTEESTSVDEALSTTTVMGGGGESFTTVLRELEFTDRGLESREEEENELRESTTTDISVVEDTTVDAWKTESP